MPKWGQEVIGDEHVLVSSGQAGYLAFALRGLEIPTSLIGNVGEDVFGVQILNDCRLAASIPRALRSAGVPNGHRRSDRAQRWGTSLCDGPWLDDSFFIGDGSPQLA